MIIRRNDSKFSARCLICGMVIMMVSACSAWTSSPLTLGFSINGQQLRPTAVYMVLDAGMESRLDGIRRSYMALTERLGDPDVIADSNLLRKVMADRAQSEEVVLAYEEVSLLCLFVEILKTLACLSITITTQKMLIRFLNFLRLSNFAVHGSERGIGRSQGVVPRCRR